MTPAVVDCIRRVGVRIGTSALYYSGVPQLLRRSVEANRRKPHSDDARFSPFAILLYHRVNPDCDPFFPAVPMKTFEAQMRFLAKNFCVLPLSEILRRITENDKIEPWTIAITFDDGYKDNYLYANPILKKYGLPATLFVATAYVGRREIMWNDRFAWAVKHTRQSRITFQALRKARSFSLDSRGARVSAFVSIIAELKTFPETEKRRVLEALVAQLENKKQEPDPLMVSWPELRELANEGWEIGSHTQNHTILTNVDESEAKNEINQSKAALEENLQRRVNLFAYPNGKTQDFNPAIKTLLQEAGFDAAMTSLGGLNGRDVDFFEIRRQSPWEEDLPSFALKLQRSYLRAM